MSTSGRLQLELPGERSVFSVSALNREARLILESGLGTVWVEGEISNLSRPSSGHMYWSLKDDRAQLRCAMFRQSNRRLGFELANGQQVLVRGRISLYEARGDFQLIADYVEESGEGELRRRFEALKRKLAAEGLFDAERKQALPRLPRRIGVVTSPTGAAIRDVLIALRRRFPAVRVLIYPTRVQGEGAAAEIASRLALADRRGDCDLLILTRGGGSLEDLWAFNEEAVARAVAAVETPIIVGVGHEVDFTIAEFAADLRAPTPSQAAELAVPNRQDFVAAVQRAAEQLRRAALRSIEQARSRAATLAHRLQRAHPGVALRTRQQRLDELEARLTRAVERRIAADKLRHGRLASRIRAASPRLRIATARDRWRRNDEKLRSAIASRLDRLTRRISLAERSLRSLSPVATLARGYAIVTRADDGTLLRDATAVEHGTGIAVRLARGHLTATVDDTEK
jgi:exodeoxyribonuclease VII large subunit